MFRWRSPVCSQTVKMQWTAGSGHSITLQLQIFVCLPPWPSLHLKESLKVTAWMLMSEVQVGIEIIYVLGSRLCHDQFSFAHLFLFSHPTRWFHASDVGIVLWRRPRARGSRRRRE